MPLSTQPPGLIDPPVVPEAEAPQFLFPGPGSAERQRKGWSLLLSFGLQILGMAGLLWLARFLPTPPRFLYPISQRRWTVVRLEAPLVLPPPLLRLPHRKVTPPRSHRILTHGLPVVTPRTSPEPRAQVSLPVATPALHAGPSQPVELHHPLEAAPPAVKPALQMDPPPIRVGRFGDPRGVVAAATSDAAHAPRVGSFDSGDSLRAAVAPPSRARTGAFASLDSPASPGVNARQEKIRIHGFDAAPAAGSLQAPPSVHVLVTPSQRPPVILFHPVPVYTALAQKNHIEGEVVLQAVLQRDGSVRILRVIHGLGYGLDQSARDAAQKVRFRPALRDGQPVDWTVLLHITFRLAY